MSFIKVGFLNTAVSTAFLVPGFHDTVMSPHCLKFILVFRVFVRARTLPVLPVTASLAAGRDASVGWQGQQAEANVGRLGGLLDQGKVARGGFEAWLCYLDLGHVPLLVGVSWPFCIAGNPSQPDLEMLRGLAPVLSFPFASMFFLCMGFVPKTRFGYPSQQIEGGAQWWLICCSAGAETPNTGPACQLEQPLGNGLT